MLAETPAGARSASHFDQYPELMVTPMTYVTAPSCTTGKAMYINQSVSRRPFRPSEMYGNPVLAAVKVP
jgi:hypothetical protein